MIREARRVLTQENGHEIAGHGSEGYPVAAYYNDYSHTKTTFAAWHWHPEIELIHVTQGTVIFQLPEMEIPVSSGEVLFINSGVMHAAKRGPAKECQFHTIIFSPAFVGNYGVLVEKYIQPLLSDETKQRDLFSIRDKDTVAVSERMETIWRMQKDEPSGYEFAVRDALSGICLSVLRRTPEMKDAGLSPAANERIKRMVSFIHENFREPVATKDIAAAANISESECLRCFKSSLHMTPNQYLRKRRLLEAAKELRETELSVAEIALNCGFSHMSYFADCFRKEYGVLPREYRRLNNT